MRIGDIEISAIIDGECRSAPDRLYGGGKPPAAQDWALHADDHDSHGNAIMTVGSYLIRVGDRMVLCDTGFGPRHYAGFFTGALQSSLLHLGVRPTDITDVIYSHLHVDHIGWTTVDGEAVFPNADHWIDARDWEYYTSATSELAAWEVPMISAAFGSVSEHFAPVLDRIRTFEPDTEIIAGIRALDASGHSPGNTVYDIVSRGSHGYLIGDLVHTVGEFVHDGWRLGFNAHDEQALTTVDRYRRLMADSGVPFAAAHFPGMRWGRLTNHRGGVTYEVLE